MNSDVIRTRTEKVIESASSRSSRSRGIGRISTTRMPITPSASAMSPWRSVRPRRPSRSAGARLRLSATRPFSLASRRGSWRPRTPPAPGGGTATPSSPYWRSLLRSVRIEMPRMVAAWVRLPSVCCSVSRIRSRSTSATVRPTRRRAGRLRAPGRAAPLPCRRIASGPISSPLASSTARWMQFSSSRTLPRQGCCRSRASAGSLNGRSGRPLASAYLAAKCSHKGAHVGRALAQRRQVQVDDVEAEEQVLAKAPGRDLGLEIAVGGREQADVDLDRAAPPTRSISRSCSARSSLACSRGSISLISSSSSVPPFASSNLPMRRATAPVKAPFSWPNSSDSSRFSGIAAQFTETKAALGAAAVAMDVARQHLLAGAAFAGDQDAGVGRRDLARQAKHLVHRRILEHQRAPVVADRREDRGDQLGIGRQRQELARAGPDRGDRGAGIGADPVGDHRHADALRRQRPDQPGDVARDVDQHQVGAAPGAQLVEPRLRRWHVAQLGAPLDRHARSRSRSPWLCMPTISTRMTPAPQVAGRRCDREWRRCRTISRS